MNPDPSLLLKKIECLKNQMISSGLKEGLESQRTLMLSRQLDQYIFLYQNLKTFN